MRRVHILISGKVQGVFFRANIRKKANRLNVKGYARNTNDNKVEVVAEGEGQSINALIEYCKKGPILARIDSVDIKEEDYKKEFNSFEVRF